MNVSEGVNEDRHPTTCPRIKRRKRIGAAQDLAASNNDEHQNATIGDDSHDGAVMDMAIKVDDEVLHLPRTSIKQFNPDKSRLIEIEASLRAMVGRTNVKRCRLGLVEAYVAAEVERRDRATRSRVKKELGRPKRWKSR